MIYTQISIGLAVVWVTCGLVAGSQYDYAPVTQACSFPANSDVVSSFVTASASERAWVSSREQTTEGAWVQYFTNLNLSNFAVTDAVASGKLPRVAIAASGGGYRAMLNGGGVLSALDSNNRQAINEKTGGLLQLSTYLAGLSGGSWLTSMLVDQNGVSVDNWSLNITQNLLEPGVEEFAILTLQVAEKKLAGFDVSLVDLWGRLISYALFPKSDASETTTFSSLSQQSSIAQHQFPFPLLIAAAVPNNSTAWSESVPLEYNVFTSGINTDKMSAYLPTSLLGTTVDQGKAQNGDSCVQGFDNLGWVVGTSSAAFAVLQDTEAGSTHAKQAAHDLINLMLEAVKELSPTSYELISDLVPYTSAPLPNPLKGMYGQLWNDDYLYVGDGGLGPWGNMPLPLVTNPERQVDVILAIDSSADTQDSSGFPDGTALISAANYSQATGVPFPTVPASTQAFLGAGLGNKITFFGCNNTAVPTIVYIPNMAISYPSGTSTFKLSYNASEVAGMLANGFDIMTQDDAPTCVGCLLSAYTGYTSDMCSRCMSKYCWS